MEANLEPELSEYKTVNSKQSSSASWGIFLAVLILIVLCFILFNAKDGKQEEYTNVSNNANDEPQIELVTQPNENSIQVLFPVTLDNLREKVSLRSLNGCLAHIDRAISLYADKYIPEAFLHLQIGLENIITSNFSVAVSTKNKGAFMKSVTNLEKAGLISQEDRKMLCGLANIRNLFVHEDGYELSDIDAQKYLNRAMVMIDKMIALIETPMEIQSLT